MKPTTSREAVICLACMKKLCGKVWDCMNWSFVVCHRCGGHEQPATKERRYFFKALWSNGQDSSPSSCGTGFNSPQGYQPKKPHRLAFVLAVAILAQGCAMVQTFDQKLTEGWKLRQCCHERCR